MLIPLLYAVSALLALLPNWLAAALLPALLAGQHLLITDEERLTVGPIGVYPLDILTGLMFVKWFLFGGPQRLSANDRGMNWAWGTWATVNLLASLVAGVKFGDAHMIGCLVPWARGIADSLLMVIVADSLRSRGQARISISILLLFLFGLVAIQFVNFFGAGSGLVIGEVQGLERDQPRIFGPVGDSVGFVLLLGYVFGLCRENLVIAATFAGGILLTAGLGAVLGMAVATALFLTVCAPQHLLEARRGRMLRLLFGFGVVAALALVYAGPLTSTLRERLEAQHEESGDQRLATVRVALAMIDDNLASGVGFLGFRLVIGRYGGSDYFDLTNPDGATANANNQALQALTDAGIAGLLALAILIFAAARVVYRAAALARDPLLRAYFWAVLLWILSQAFGNVAATWLTPSSFVATLFWINLGIAQAMNRNAVLVTEGQA